MLKSSIWFPLQRWGGSLIWFTLTVQDSCSWSLRQPSSNINREKCLFRKVFTRTVRLCPLNTSFLSRRYFSKILPVLQVFILRDHFKFFLHHCTTRPIFAHFSFFFLHAVSYLNLDSLSLEIASPQAKAMIWRKETSFNFYGHTWDLFWRDSSNSFALMTMYPTWIFVFSHRYMYWAQLLKWFSL